MERSIVSDGTAQEERLLPALKPGYFNVDELRFEDLLAMAAGYAGLLKFRDPSGRPDTDWRPLFQSDEASILAELLAARPHLAEAEFVRFFSRRREVLDAIARGDGDFGMIPAFALAGRINAWFVGLGGLSNAVAAHARDRIAGVIEKTLAQELRALHDFLAGLRPDAAALAFADFDPVWEIGTATEMRLNESETDRFLVSNFHAFYNALAFLREAAEAWLGLALERHDHDPSMGLLIAFLKLFGKVQHKLNGFGRNHLDFYYRRVLRTARREFVPDSAYLVLSPDVAGREVTIPKGTAFLAGKDENNIELLYVSDDELLVTDAKVCDLYTINLERDAMSSPENALRVLVGEDGEEKQFATAIKLNRTVGGDADKEGAAWPLFGGVRRIGDGAGIEPARIGFALASGVLLMKHGVRDVSVTFKVAGETEGQGLGAFIRKLCAILGTTEADAFFKAFRHMFRIFLSAETGWYEVAEYLPLSAVVEPDAYGEDDFAIQFLLPESVGAIVPYAKALHGGGFDTDLPVIEFVVNPESYLYAYSLLSLVVVREIVIEVGVKGCTDVAMSSQLGPLSADAQFLPFGPMPARGDYFVVGCYEAARKKLTDFEVEFEWGGLPSGKDGFAEYYRAYPMRFDDAVFKGRVAVLRDRKWLPADEDDQPDVSLFETVSASDGSERTGAISRFSFRDVCRLGRPLENVAAARYGFGPVARDGFFRLRLDNPPQGFGHKEYPLVLSRVMIENARLKRFGLPGLLSKSLSPAPLPNPPYTPLVNAIRVNYRASSAIRMDMVTSAEEGRVRDRMFYLHPFGIEELSPKACGRLHLVPRIEPDGNLLIGLSGSHLAGRLTLFFHLREDSLPEAGAGEFKFAWHYLASNQWKRFAPEQVVSDTTHGFLVSGVVTLDIPADIDRQSTVLPGDRYWLRVSTSDARRNALCSLYAVHAQALKVTWRRQEKNSAGHLSEALPAGSIKSAKTTLPGIAGIRQVMDSWGGAPAESEEQWVTRVSERLKHKNRAVTPWDYERLVLQRFPEIYKVKCFSGLAGDDESGARIQPGGLMVVLVPRPMEPVMVNPRPMASALLLREVREFVAELASPFARVEVRNPSYEQVQVRCQIRFRQGRGDGQAISRLNQALFDYLSPWHEGGRGAGFGWRIRCDDVQSYLLDLDEVESVTALSLLHVRESGRQLYRFSDTATQHDREVLPAHPWSIAIPFRQHLIEPVSDSDIRPPNATGIADLAIGSTFILSRDHS